MRNLASIQEISNLQPIEGADLIESAQLLGWNCVVRKGEFKVGDKAVFCEVDSVLPDKDWSKFMEPRKFRVKTIRLKKVLSQGLALPLSILDSYLDQKKISKLKVGDDVTAVLEVTKFEVHDRHSGGSNNLWAPTDRPFPSFVPKTDETRLQSVLSVLNELENMPFYITMKYDGTSATFARKNGRFWACSRNRAVKRNNVELFYKNIYNVLCKSIFTRWLVPLWTVAFKVWSKYFTIPELKGQEENTWWNMVDRYDLEYAIPEGYAIQGEICGPGIQGNKLNLTEKDLFVFNVFNINENRYLGYEEFLKFCLDHQLNHVEVLTVEINRSGFELSLKNLLNFAKGKYPNTSNHREGIVIRPLVETYSEKLKGRLSFKVINNDFLLKYE